MLKQMHTKLGRLNYSLLSQLSWNHIRNHSFMILIGSEGTRGYAIGISCIFCGSVLWYSVHINCDIWLQVQDTDMDACSLTSWKCPKFLWQSDPEIFWVTGFLHTHFSTMTRKTISFFFFFFSRKNKTLKPLLVRVKHGQRFQNTNYNRIVSWDFLKALVWFIYPPSTSFCWMNVSLSVG